MRKTTRKPLVTPERHVGGSKYSTADKLTATRSVKQLMSNGTTKWTALGRIAKDYNVSSATMSNWLKKFQDVTVSLHRQSNGNMAHAATLRNNHTDGFTIQSVNLRTTDGAHVQLTPVDIAKIATLASTIC